MTENFPNHIAIIMDGNRRWAKQNGLPVFAGHQIMVEEKLEILAKHCIERKILYLTLWAFSTENWHRPPQEVKFLMDLFRHQLQKSIEQLNQLGVKLNTIGDLSKFDQKIQDGINDGIKKTKNNTQLTLTIALNYGGHDELVRAVNQIKNLPITAKQIEENLDTADLPNIDFIIRPGGEQRLSGFLSWQSAYSELYFTDVLMPDFGPEELDQAIDEFQKRQRRFGK